MVVDDLQNLRLIQTLYGLRPLIVVHQHHTLAPGAQQVIPGQGADDLFVLVQHRVAAVAALQHHLPHVVNIVRQMEADDVVSVAGAGDGDGLIDKTGHPAGIVGAGNDAGILSVCQQRLIYLRLAQDQAAYIGLQRPANHVRLVAAQDDMLPTVPQQILAALGQGNDHVAGNRVHQITGVVEDTALDDAQKIEQGQCLHAWLADGVHAVCGDVTGGEGPIQGAVLVDHGDGGDALLPHNVPGPVHGDGGVQGRRRIIIQIRHLCADILDQLGWLETEAIQQTLGLVADVAQIGRYVVPVAQSIPQSGIGHGSHDRIRVGVPMPDYIDLVHTIAPFCSVGVIYVLIIIIIRRKGNLSMRGYAGKEDKIGVQIRQSGENVGKAALCVGCIQCAGMCCCLLTF